MYTHIYIYIIFNDSILFHVMLYDLVLPAAGRAVLRGHLRDVRVPSRDAGWPPALTRSLTRSLARSLTHSLTHQANNDANYENP